jgi:alkylation response protein AidB-like acyl-CoA dehydrogenase
MAAPTIHEYGTCAQRALLRPLFSGEHIWGQLFSEPGAGSDLASLAMRATRDGDGWVLNGQKVWTSLGHVARYGLLLARHDPSLPKHHGLTYFVLDMSLPGIEVRPLRQMTGEAEFNEVFLTDVPVPDSARLGEVGTGWQVAMTTLANERLSLGAAAGTQGSGPIAQAVELWHEAAARGPVEPELLDRLLVLWCRAEAARLMNVSAAQADGVGPRGSLAKLQMAELNQSIYDLCVDLMGLPGVLYDSYEATQPDRTSVHGSADPRRAFLRTMANSIEGGTSEIQRTIIAERVLGLPAEPRTDKGTPWNEVRRS